MNKPISIIALFVLLGIGIASQNCFAQAKKGQIGLSIALQDVQQDIVVPIWITDKIVVAPALGLVSIRDARTDLSVAWEVKYYPSKEKLSPYGGSRFALLFAFPDKGDTVFDYLLGVAVGAEYFFDSRFSIGDEVQLNQTFIDDLSPRSFGDVLNTGAVVYATFYF